MVNSLSHPLKVVVMIFIFLVVVAGIWVAILWFNLPKDIFHQNITIEEAQRLVSFQICLPAYTPAGIENKPQIAYQSDAANAPEETYIRLRYNRIDNRKMAFEIYQRYTPDAGMATAYPPSVLEANKVILLDWISHPKVLSESELKAAREKIKMDASVFQTEQIMWWLYEIVNPGEYRSTMTRWTTNHVEYRILSYLPVDEIRKITISMFDCSSP